MGERDDHLISLPNIQGVEREHKTSHTGGDGDAVICSYEGGKLLLELLCDGAFSQVLGFKNGFDCF